MWQRLFFFWSYIKLCYCNLVIVSACRVPTALNNYMQYKSGIPDFWLLQLHFFLLVKSKPIGSLIVRKSVNLSLPDCMTGPAPNRWLSVIIITHCGTSVLCNTTDVSTRRDSVRHTTSDICWTESHFIFTYLPGPSSRPVGAWYFVITPNLSSHDAMRIVCVS